MPVLAPVWSRVNTSPELVPVEIPVAVTVNVGKEFEAVFTAMVTLKLLFEHAVVEHVHPVGADKLMPVEPGLAE